MMKCKSNFVIRVNGLSKTYQLYNHHSDRLKEALHPFRKKYHKNFKALEDINFQINASEALGILGSNGSGKSTLLKIIAGVLTPTTGTVQKQGTVSSLLELGTGFNPELTGLQNIYFSGMIQGRDHQDMERIIPDISDFAEIGEYLYQPVKTYSSGMFARLAFALAVNVDPDILIVDEALSVGDMRFQQKCIRKMQDFRKRGKTILFVSHDTSTVATFCDRVVWLDQGKIRAIGCAEEICKRYAAFMAYGQDSKVVEQTNVEKSYQSDGASHSRGIQWMDVAGTESFGEGGARILHVAIIDDETGQSIHQACPGQNVRLVMRINCDRPLNDVGFGLLVKNYLGLPIFTINNYYLHNPIKSLPRGMISVTFVLNFPWLSSGNYGVSLAVGEGSLHEHRQLHWVHDALYLKVCESKNALTSDCLLVMPRDSWSVYCEVE